MTTDKHNTEDLPEDVNTCHEMIFVMSDSIRELSSEREQLKKREEELLAKIQHLLLGNRREKYIDPKHRRMW